MRSLLGAVQPIAEGITMAAKKRVFISFDYDHDEGAKIMLAGQAKLPDSPFDFTDASVKEPLSGDWKEKVKRRMANIDVVIGLCGQYTHTARARLPRSRSLKRSRFRTFFWRHMQTKHARSQPPRSFRTKSIRGRGTI